MKPRIDRSNIQSIVVKVGLTLSLDINIIGEPPPKVEWKFKGEDLKQDDQIRIDNIDYNTKFFIMRAKRSHAGKYTIRASNSVGEDVAELEVTVLGKKKKNFY